MIHPDTELFHVGREIGRGVRATRPIPRGTLVWILDPLDRLLSPEDLAALPARFRRLVRRYGYLDPLGRHVVCWDEGRFVNHSCAPTMRGLGPDVQLAVRDIAAGEEITCDYAECNVDPPLHCRCGVAACRGRVSARDLLRHAERWDAEIRAALPAARRVPQPLWPYLTRPAEVRAMLRGAPALRSIRELYRAPARRRPARTGGRASAALRRVAGS